MKSFRAVFQIIEDNNCPLYELEDIFTLTDKSISFPGEKESCLILVREMTQLLFQLLGEAGTKKGSKFSKKYTCSGCTGLIKFTQIPGDDFTVDNGKTTSLLTEKEQNLFDKIVDYPLLRAIPANHLKNFIGCFKAMVVTKGSQLIKKGQPNKHLFILLSGQVIVEDGGVPITRLSEGEVCGEMSYFGDSIASSSVRATENSKILAIRGDDFSNLIKKSDSVQFYMAKLLAKRLSKSNQRWASDFESCMQGRINEMAPAELLQVFHMHQKSGVLSLDLPHGAGRVAFHEGSIVVAGYDGKSGQEAIFAILEEREGMYRFSTGLSSDEMQKPAIGDFMMLLMEGIKRIDED